jgi:hypothetical protein
VCDTGKTSPLNDDEIELNYHKLTCLLIILSLLFLPRKILVLPLWFIFLLRHKHVLRFLFEAIKDLLGVLMLRIIIEQFLVTLKTGVGCASFGHSCYGGFGKRSLTAPPATDNIQQMEPIAAGEHTGSLIPMKAFQRHFQFRPDLQQSDNFEQEKDLKIVVLNTLSQIIDDTLKRISSDYESN